MNKGYAFTISQRIWLSTAVYQNLRFRQREVLANHHTKIGDFINSLKAVSRVGIIMGDPFTAVAMTEVTN